MNIIQHLQQNKSYLTIAHKALQIKFETIDIDYNKGETDNTLILYIDKNNYSFEEAMAILTMKQKMLQEEWEDLELYDKDDIATWANMLQKEYSRSTYFENVTDDEFSNNHFMHRLQFADGINSIYCNDIQISHAEFLLKTPCKKEYLKISKSSYTNLEAEYYLETQTHFVLFNWYTTA